MIDPSDVQSILTRSYAKALAVVLLFNIEDAGLCRRFLSTWLPLVPRGFLERDPATPILHFYFSWSGLQQLLRANSTLDIAMGRSQLEWAFTDPSQAPDRAAMRDQLGFVGASHSQNWWNGRFETSDIHLALQVFLDDEAQKTSVLAQIRESATANGLRELQISSFADKALSGYRPPDGRLHFGYRDGITSPNVNWYDRNDHDGVDVREFLVGYPTDVYPTSPQRAGPWQDFARNGSYVALAWMYQDAARFNAFLEEHAPLAARHVDEKLSREWLAAKLMGRWRDGSPLARYPDGNPKVPDLKSEFDYSDDPRGVGCPLTAHIRVVNCRAQPLSYANQRRFPAGPPRLIRRGFSYGPKLQGSDDDGKDRGVVGLFYFARLNEQFYTVLRWMQQTEFSDSFGVAPYTYSNQDALVGIRAKSGAKPAAAIPLASGETLRMRLGDFVTYKGVAALFAPSTTAIAAISERT
jgi:deferrochelatase/peroxidase EfeB